MICPFTQKVMVASENDPPMEGIAHFTVSDRAREGALITLRINNMRVTFASDKLEKILARTRSNRK